MSTKTCLVADGASIDRWLRGEWQSLELAHSEACEACAAIVDAWQRAARDLGAARDATAATEIDLVAGTMGAIRSTSERPQRRWRWVAVPALAACAALLLMWSTRSNDEGALHLRAAGTVLLVEKDGRDAPLTEGSHVLRAPATLRTGADGSADLRTGLVQAQLGADSELRVSGGELELLGGVARVRAIGGDLRIPSARVELVGNVDVEVFEGEKESSEMNSKLKDRKSIAGAAVVAVVALYGGHAVISSDSEREELHGPIGASVTRSGKVATFPLEEEHSVAGARVASGGDSAESGGEDDERLGARWDEAKQVVVFAVPGEVFDGDTGQPIASYRVTARAVEARGFGQSLPRTIEVEDEEGHFLLEGLGFATWSLRFESQGYAPVTTEVSLVDFDSDPYVAIGMTEGASLSGQVVDWRGRPVADAAVGLRECFGDDGEVRPGCSTTKSGVDGMFHLPRLPEEEVFSIYADHPRYGSATVFDQRRVAGETSHVVVTLSGVVRIHGRVTSGEEGRPVPEAMVVIEDSDSAFTDAGGRYEIFTALTEYPRAYVDTVGGAPIGRVTSHPESRSSWPMRWVGAPTHVAEIAIDFQLAMENGSISGVVRSGGEPVVGADLRFSNTTGWSRRDHESYPTHATTDAAGRYKLENVPVAAGYQVETRSEGEDEWRPLGYVSVPDETPVVANFELGTGSIRGRTVLGNGEPFLFPSEDCRDFAALSLDRGYHRRVRCFSDGRFEVTDLAPGRYRLEHRAEWMGGAVEYESTEVEVGPGAIVGGVEVTVRGEGTEKWIFRVLDRTGRFVAGPYLRVVDGNKSMTSNLHVRKDGTAVGSVGRKYDSVFIDAAGYAPATVELRGRDPSEVIDVRMEKLE